MSFQSPPNTSVSTPTTPSVVHKLFEEQVERSPKAIAVRCKEASLSYAELDRRANQLSHFLIAKGCGPDRPVGIYLERSLEMIISVLAVLKSGSCYLPLDPAYPQPRISFMLDNSKTQLVLTQDSLKNQLVHNETNHLSINVIDEIDLSGDKPSPDIAASLDDLCYLMYTSGSTGQPKGVMMPHGSLSNLLQWQCEEFDVKTLVKVLQFTPLSFDVSFQEIFSTLSTGSELLLITDEHRLDPEKLISFVQQHQVSRLFLPFIALQQLSDAALLHSEAPSSLKEIITAGEQLQVNTHIRSFFKALPECSLSNQYGPSETHVVSALKLTGDPDLWPALPAIGKAINNTELLILDENKQVVQPGVTGELYMAGKCLARGYINRDDLTAERFVPHITDADSLMYASGDLVKADKHGCLQYVGRIDDQAKIRGYRIETSEIELALSACPGVSQAVVKVEGDSSTDKRLVAFYIKESDQNISASQIRRSLADNLPDYMIPAVFVPVLAFPKTPSGKVDRKALVASDTSRPELDVAYVPAKGTLESVLVTLWKNILQLDKVGVNDTFFDLGGNSLLSIKVITGLRHETGIDVSVVDFFSNPTIAGLADFLDHSARPKNDSESASKPQSSDFNGVAVIGMAARFPGAKDTTEYWQNLIEGRECSSFFTTDEIDSSIDLELRHDPAYVAVRGLIENADCFDAAFFGVNPREAEIMDPQQRLFLQECWHAFEDAGIDPSKVADRVGVYGGVGNNSYQHNNVSARPDIVELVGEFQAMIGNEKDYVATRVAHKLNLRGPALSIHTACSTSLVAISEAYFALKQGRCELALAGGSSVTSPIASGHRYDEGGIMSIDGHCRPFDADATGTVFSDGVGAVLLKPLTQAMLDGDPIYAVIRGAATNNDGANKMSFMSPSAEGQSAAITQAQQEAGISADDISYIEAHGTATPIGDPIEINALNQVFARQTDQKQFCAIGSVKSNFGHLTAAAGVAGFIKTCLALKHAKIPPSINYHTPNPKINFEKTAFYVADALQNWQDDEKPLRAGVSAFGVGGTNAHVILEEAPSTASNTVEKLSPQLLVLSAKSTTALDAGSEQLTNALKANTNIADIAYTLQTGRAEFDERRFYVLPEGTDKNFQLQSLKAPLTAARQCQSQNTATAFMFPGQGTQYINMARGLYESDEPFKHAMDKCFSILKTHANMDLSAVLYPTQKDEKQAAKILSQTSYAQPALFSVGYSLAQLWKHYGVAPKALIGHSIGEFTAACISGVFTLEEALLLVVDRGKLMQALPEGSMISVRLAANILEPQLPTNCSIAAINGPHLCVASGPIDAISALQKQLTEKEVVCRKLHTSHAFHSPMMDPIVEVFKNRVASVNRNKPQIPFVSTTKNGWISDEDACSPDYWANHLRLPVRFAEGIETLWAEHDYALLELGPGASATTIAKQKASKLDLQHATPCLPTANSKQNDEESILAAAGQLWLSGVTLNWSSFHATKRRRVNLPGYVFDTKRYWIEPGNPHPKTVEPTAYMAAASINEEHLMPSTAVHRKDELIAQLRDLLEDTSGIDLSTANASTTFFEMGLDSLFLTQASISIKKRFSVAVSFRQLIEDLTTLDDLAAFIDAELPVVAHNAVPQVAVVPQAPTAPGLPSAVSPVVGAAPIANSTAIEAIISQQMKIMSQQLQMLQSGSIATPTTDDKPLSQSPIGAQTKITLQKKAKMTVIQEKAVASFTSAYNEKTTLSKAYAQKHRKHLADPRTVSGFTPAFKELVYPIVVKQSQGSKLIDLDDNEYIDMTNGFGSNFLGHSHEAVTKALHDQLDLGVEIGPQTPLAGEVAELFCEMTGLDRAAFCNTGSEAVLGAMRLARTVTGNDLIVYFNEDYHGIFDEVVVRGTASHKSLPGAPGIPAGSVNNVLLLDYDSEESLTIIRERASEIAGVMVEPVQSRHPNLQPVEFLKKLRELTREIEVPMIIDEVITGFRIHPGGAQAHFGIKGDIATYGKIVGGGMPIGVIAGSNTYMDALDGGQWQFGDESFPQIGVTYFAGTFVRHPLAMAAAKAVLTHLKTEGPELQKTLNEKTTKMVEDLNTLFKSYQCDIEVENFGSLFKIRYEETEPYAELLFYWLRHCGLHIWDARPCFLTTTHSDTDIQNIVDTFKRVISELSNLGIIGSIKEPLASISELIQNQNTPPKIDAKLGKTATGEPAWFVPDPDVPGKFRFLKGA